MNILDYTLTNHINFEADIHFPVEAGVVQVETFGVSVNSDGTIFYGMQIEASVLPLSSRGSTGLFLACYLALSRAASERGTAACAGDGPCGK